MEEKKLTRQVFTNYGDQVKRQLESFDLEASLNEVSRSDSGVWLFADVSRWPKVLAK